MASRSLPAGLYLSGVALVGVAAFNYSIQTGGPGVRIDEPDRKFPAYTIGQELGVEFRIHNPTGHTVRIVGLAEC